VFAKQLSGNQRGIVVRTEPLVWCVGPTSVYVTRTCIFEALKAAGRPYRIALVSSSVAVIRAAVTAGLGVSAFAGYVIPEGLVRLDQGLPALGALDYGLRIDGIAHELK
jgi:DNA-binding transcriptional LysR family regulator